MDPRRPTSIHLSRFTLAVVANLLCLGIIAVALAHRPLLAAGAWSLALAFMVTNRTAPAALSFVYRLARFVGRALGYPAHYLLWRLRWTPARFAPRFWSAPMGTLACDRFSN